MQPQIKIKTTLISQHSPTLHQIKTIIMTAEDEAKQLDSVTDNVQEKELDKSRANQALGALAGGTGGATTSSTAKAIAVKKEDVDVIVAELEVTEDEAAAALRETAAANGSLEGQALVAAALTRLVVS